MSLLNQYKKQLKPSDTEGQTISMLLLMCSYGFNVGVSKPVD